MPYSAGLLGPAVDGWSWRHLNDMRRAVDTADPGMELPPPDPGDRMPNLGYGPGHDAAHVPASALLQALQALGRQT